MNGEAENAAFDPIAAQVFRLYRTALDRVPDPAGYLDWTGRIGDGGLTLLHAASGFLGSAEFRAASTGTFEFVTQLCDKVLERPPMQPGWRAGLRRSAAARSAVPGWC